MKYLTPILLFAAFTVGTTVSQPSLYNEDETEERQIYRLDKSSIPDPHRNTVSTEQSPELRDFHFRGMGGPEAFDEYLNMLGSLS